MNDANRYTREVAPLRVMPVTDDVALDFGILIAILKRGLWLIAAAGAIGTLIAGVMVLQVPASYSSSAKILLGQNSRFDDPIGAMLPELRLDDTAVSGEIAILTSERLLAEVSRTLDLKSHPEFIPDAGDSGPGLADRVIDWGVDVVEWVLGQGQEPQVAGGDASGNAQVSPVRNAALTGMERLGDQSSAVGRLARSLRVSQEGRSNLLVIRYVSSDRLLAAAVPNTLVEVYLDDKVNSRLEVLTRLTSQLEVRLENMRARLEAQERAVIEFRNQNLAEGFGTRGQLEQQIENLSARLSVARAESAELASDIQSIDRIISENGALAAVGLFASPVITDLLENLARLRERADRLSSRFGSDVPQLAEVLAEVERLEASLTAEIMRLRDTRAPLAELSAQRAASLQSELSTLEQRALVQAEREVQLAQLEREQAAAQVVYETFLDRFAETREMLDINEGDAQIIEYADPPAGPFAPNKKLAAALGGLAGVFLGVAFVFLRHLTHRRVITTRELERQLPSFTVLPMPRARTLLRRGDPLSRVLGKGNSLLSNAVRALRSSVLLPGPSVVAVVGQSANAGGTTTAINLARSIADTGRSCVLVGGHLGQNDLANALNIAPGPGLSALLSEQPEDLTGVVQADPESPLYVIAAGDGASDPSAALLSRHLGPLVTELKNNFEVVIFEAGPLLSGMEAMPILQHCDTVVMVVPYGADIDGFRIALTRLGHFALRSRIAVLNLIPPRDASSAA